MERRKDGKSEREKEQRKRKEVRVSSPEGKERRDRGRAHEPRVQKAVTIQRLALDDFQSRVRILRTNYSFLFSVSCSSPSAQL